MANDVTVTEHTAFDSLLTMADIAAGRWVRRHARAQDLGGDPSVAQTMLIQALGLASGAMHPHRTVSRASR
jgi:hypothetical protein